MVMMRSLAGKKPERALSSVVLPVEVPPERIRFEARQYAGLEEVGHVLAHRVGSYQVVDRQDGLGELADADAGPDQGERRDDHVDARAVGQPCVDHRAALVNATPQRRDDAVDDAQDLGTAAEANIGFPKDAIAFDINLVGAIDQDFGDVVVVEKRFDWPIPQHVSDDLFQQVGALGTAQRQPLFDQCLVEDPLEGAAHLLDVGRAYGGLSSESRRR